MDVVNEGDVIGFLGTPHTFGKPRRVLALAPELERRHGPFHHGRNLVHPVFELADKRLGDPQGEALMVNVDDGRIRRPGALDFSQHHGIQRKLELLRVMDRMGRFDVNRDVHILPENGFPGPALQEVRAAAPEPAVNLGLDGTLVDEFRALLHERERLCGRLFQVRGLDMLEREPFDVFKLMHDALVEQFLRQLRKAVFARLIPIAVIPKPVRAGGVLVKKGGGDDGCRHRTLS